MRRQFNEETIEDKARNIIQVCCEPMFDDLVESYEWSKGEADFADEVIAKQMEVATFELLEIANRRITHKRKHERRTKLTITDLRTSVIMAYIMNVPDATYKQLEETFLSEHGAMYFKD